MEEYYVSVYFCKANTTKEKALALEMERFNNGLMSFGDGWTKDDFYKKVSHILQVNNHLYRGAEYISFHEVVDDNTENIKFVYQKPTYKHILTITLRRILKHIDQNE